MTSCLLLWSLCVVLYHMTHLHHVLINSIFICRYQLVLDLAHHQLVVVLLLQEGGHVLLVPSLGVFSPF